jgi:hypothetical protein
MHETPITHLPYLRFIITRALLICLVLALGVSLIAHVALICLRPADAFGKIYCYDAKPYRFRVSSTLYSSAVEIDLNKSILYDPIDGYPLDQAFEGFHNPLVEPGEYSQSVCKSSYIQEILTRSRLHMDRETVFIKYIESGWPLRTASRIEVLQLDGSIRYIDSRAFYPIPQLVPLRFHAWNFVLSAALYFVVLVIIYALIKGYVYTARVKKNKCPICNYDITSPSRSCSECGWGTARMGT